MKKCFLISHLNLHGNYSSGNFLRCCHLLPWRRPSPCYNNLPTNSPDQNPLWELFRDTVLSECSSLKMVEKVMERKKSSRTSVFGIQVGTVSSLNAHVSVHLNSSGKNTPCFPHIPGSSIMEHPILHNKNFRRPLTKEFRSVHVYKINDS